MGLTRRLVLERLEEREELGSTGFGRGVAIPHARDRRAASGRSRRCCKLEEPVEFDAADGMPVDLVFGLLSPETAASAIFMRLPRSRA